MLVHARYALSPQDQPVGAHHIGASKYAPRIHKPHTIHAQHRRSTASVLQWLVKKLDVRTRECVFVNPSRGIRRPPYVPEMARELGLCERTITRCLGSLTRSRYVFRSGKRFFITRLLFVDLKMDVTYDRMCNQLAGLAKAGMRSKVKSTPSNQVVSPVIHASHKPFDPSPPTMKSDPELGQCALLGIRRRLRSKPPD